jgi:hypothetical protein
MFTSLTRKRALTGLLLVAAAAGATACSSDVTGPKPSDMMAFRAPTPKAGFQLGAPKLSATIVRYPQPIER